MHKLPIANNLAVPGIFQYFPSLFTLCFDRELMSMLWPVVGKTVHYFPSPRHQRQMLRSLLSTCQPSCVSMSFQNRIGRRQVPLSLPSQAIHPSDLLSLQVWPSQVALKSYLHTLPLFHGWPPPPPLMPAPAIASAPLNWVQDAPTMVSQVFSREFILDLLSLWFLYTSLHPKPVWQIALGGPLYSFLEVWSWHLLLHEWHFCLGAHHTR